MMIVESIGSFGSITAMSVLPLELSKDGAFMLVGMCSRILVYDVRGGGRDDIVGSIVALPHGLRVHGIQWIRGASPCQFYIMAYGGRCLTILEMFVSTDGDSSGCSIQHLVTESSSCPAWILAGSFIPLATKNKGAFASVGMIHNHVCLFHFDPVEKSLRYVCDFRGEARTMLYSMDLSTSVTEEDGGVVRYECTVSGGTMLWDVFVWSIVLSCQFVSSNTLIPGVSRVESPRVIGQHSGSIHCLAWNSRGNLLASGSDDRVVKVWSVEESRSCIDLYGSGGRIWALCFSPMDDFLFTGSEDGHVYCWNLQTKKLHTTFRAHAYMGVRNLRLHANHLCSGGADGFVKVWNLSEYIPMHYLNTWYDSGFAPAYRFDLFQISHCIGTENHGLVTVSEEVAQDAVPLSRPSEHVACLLESYGKLKRENFKSFETIKAMCLIFSGNILILATDKGHLIAMDLSASNRSDEQRSEVLYSTQYNSAVPIINVTAYEYWDETIVGCCDAHGILHLIRLQQDSGMPRRIGSCTVKGSTCDSRMIDAFIVGVWGSLFTLAFSSIGNLEVYRVTLQDNGMMEMVLISTAICPLRRRITALSLSETSDNRAIVALGSARGGVSIWDLDNEKGLTCLASQMTAHDETPVQFVEITRVDQNVYEIETGALDFCIQKYVLEIHDCTSCLQRKNEYRLDSLKVISDSFRLLGNRKCYLGFFTNQFILWDIDMDAEIWNVHCAGWKRPWAFHVDTLGGRVLFCYSSGCGDVHVYHKYVNNVCDVPHCLVSGGHGREINSVVDLGRGVLLTAGADATLHLSKWCHVKNSNVLVSTCVSTQPFGTSTRMLRALATADGFIIVSGGAKTVMTAWKYRWDGSPRIQNMSTFADQIVSKIGKTEKNTVDSRVLCFTLLSQPADHACLAIVVMALSNGKIEVRNIPSRVHIHRLMHEWPLIANLSAPESIGTYPVLSLDNSQGFVFAGNTNGDILIWNMARCLKETQNSSGFEVLPSKVIYSFHLCGINTLSLKPVSSGSQMHVVTGGDDQALGVFCFEPYSLNVERQLMIRNAHASSIRDLCVYENVIFSIGLDQYLRIWKMNTSTPKIKIVEASAVHLQVLEPNSLSISNTPNDTREVFITIAGRGIETLVLDEKN